MNEYNTAPANTILILLTCLFSPYMTLEKIIINSTSFPSPCSFGISQVQNFENSLNPP